MQNAWKIQISCIYSISSFLNDFSHRLWIGRKWHDNWLTLKTSSNHLLFKANFAIAVYIVFNTCRCIICGFKLKIRSKGKYQHLLKIFIKNKPLSPHRWNFNTKNINLYSLRQSVLNPWFIVSQRKKLKMIRQLRWMT